MGPPIPADTVIVDGAPHRNGMDMPER